MIVAGMILGWIIVFIAAAGSAAGAVAVNKIPRSRR